MKFFIDSADLVMIEKLLPIGLIDGVTTNPSLLAKLGKNYLSVIKEICNLIMGPISVEVVATDYQQMLKEAAILQKISHNIVIKLPMTVDGVRACKELTNNNIKVNLTLCFSASQAIIAAKAGATYISPFVGRLDDIGYKGMDLIKDIIDIYHNYDHFTTKVLVASVRSINHLVEAAKLGADAVTLPVHLFEQLVTHPLTDQGLAKFLTDWQLAGHSII